MARRPESARQVARGISNDVVRPRDAIFDLEAKPQAAGQVRSLLSALLAPSLPREVVETAQLLLSEIVTNAIRHAQTPTTARVVLGASALRAEVYDRDSRVFDVPDIAPRTGQPVLFRESGIGLFVVDRLADRWGIEVHETGKCVWFELDVR
jgi:anti-sigma regulatory factor (Ser/Thr protein kinase)